MNKKPKTATDIQAATELPEDSLLSVQQVLCLVPMGKTTLYSMIALGEFPKPVKIRAMAVWHKKIVVDWLNKIYEKQVEENQP